MNIQPMDWSATAAWIALAISIIGTIIGPIITSLITNKHQLKLRELDTKQSALDTYKKNRFDALNTFISKAGRCLSYLDEQSVMDFGEAYHCIYQYVPKDFWNDLDQFYSIVTSYNWNEAKKLYPPIVRRLSEILKETPQVYP